MRYHCINLNCCVLVVKKRKTPTSWPKTNPNHHSWALRKVDTACFFQNMTSNNAMGLHTSFPHSQLLQYYCTQHLNCSFWQLSPIRVWILKPRHTWTITIKHNTTWKMEPSYKLEHNPWNFNGRRYFKKWMEYFRNVTQKSLWVKYQSIFHNNVQSLKR